MQRSPPSNALNFGLASPRDIVIGVDADEVGIPADSGRRSHPFHPAFFKLQFVL
jgi:hypothetical protein